MLIDKGVNINAVDENHNSALILAANQGPESMVRLLIENGADVNAVGDKGRTALISSAFDGKSYGRVSQTFLDTYAV